MGLVFKSFLIVVLILLILALIRLTFNTGLITGFFIERVEKLFYVFELEKNYDTKVSIIEQQNISELFLGMTADNLEFGVMPQGSVSSRFLNMTNDDEMDYKILFIVTGNITPMVKFNKNDFVLHKDENTTITVFLDSSFASNPGNYTGEISIVSKKPRFSFLNNLMDD